MSDYSEQIDQSVDIERTAEEINAKIDELRAFNDYGRGLNADQLRREHGAWIKALRWVLGSDLVEEP